MAKEGMQRAACECNNLRPGPTALSLTVNVGIVQHLAWAVTDASSPISNSLSRWPLYKRYAGHSSLGPTNGNMSNLQLFSFLMSRAIESRKVCNDAYQMRFSNTQTYIHAFIWQHVLIAAAIEWRRVSAIIRSLHLCAGALLLRFHAINGLHR